MRAPLLLTAIVLTTLSTAQATGHSTVALGLSVGRSCLWVNAGAAASELVLKCNRDSVAPQSPLEVVAAPVADWQLSSHARSTDGGELFTYVRRDALASVSATLNFY